MKIGPHTYVYGPMNLCVFRFKAICAGLHTYVQPPCTCGAFSSQPANDYFVRLTMEMMRAVMEATALITLPPTPRKVEKAELLTFWLLFGST